MATLTTVNIRLELRPTSDYGEASSVAEILRGLMRENGVTLTHFHIDRDVLPDDTEEIVQGGRVVGRVPVASDPPEDDFPESREDDIPL